MYKVTVPVMLQARFDQAQTLMELQRANAQRVFLAIPILSFQPEKRNEILALLRENIPFFQANGLETGVWFWTFLRSDPEYDTKNCTQQVNHLGDPVPGAYCPASPGYLADCTEFITEVAKLGPDLLQFDDDFRIPSNDSSVGCFCERHMAIMQQSLGESISRKTLYQKAFAAGPNRYREAVMRATGQSMERFAEAMRQAVDAVNPRIRFSLCSCMPTWDVNGTNSIRIAKLLAGSTRPLMRLIGAPYWSTRKSWGNRLQHTIELARMESSWCDKEAMEIMSEGDVWPRPRYRVPASCLEGFDTALRFSGETDGILKYMLDYTSSPRYETGYVDRHVKHQPDYEKISTMFSGMCSVGVRVYNAMSKFSDADMTGIDSPSNYGWDIFFSRAARLLADNTVPTTYRGTGICGIAFGENARHLPEDAFCHGLILDIRAAKILMEKGIDVGLETIGNTCKAELLYYPRENEYVISGYDDNAAYHLVPKSRAEVITYSLTHSSQGSTLDHNEPAQHPDTILYTNDQGQKFLILGFDAYLITDDSRWRSYSMQRQLMYAVQWFTGRPLPASCQGHPDLYMQCKTDGSSLGVGLWNFFPDEIDQPVITLNQNYQTVEFINCSGRLQENVVELSSLSPYGYAFFKVTK